MSAAYKPPQYDPDTQQMLRAGRGETGALDGLVTGHYRRVRSFCARLLDSPEAARDVTQEVFLRVVANAHTFGGRSSFRTWLLARRRLRHSIDAALPGSSTCT